MGTRGSPLALAQARQFARQLEAAHENLVVEERIIRTTGDKNQTASLPAIGGKGVFTLEIEAALLDGSIDFAVHSLKDLPPDLPAGLTLGCIPKRESARDMFVVRDDYELVANANKLSQTNNKMMMFPFLKRCARVGTSSLRRRAALLSKRSDLQIEDIRGNIDTRIRKMHEQEFDAIVLAEAGLRRLGWKDAFRLEIAEITCTLHPVFDSVPAPGQGALAVECRDNDNRVLDLLRALENEATRIETAVERAIVRALNAGCSTPLGVHAHFQDDGQLLVVSRVLSPDGKLSIDEDRTFRHFNDPEKTGLIVAQELLKKGAQKLLNTNH